MRQQAKATSLKRLKRIEGQVRGLARMVEEDRYCIDIVTQIGAVRAALRKVEEEVLRDHVGALRRGRDRVRQQEPAAAQDRRADGRVRPGGSLMRSEEEGRRKSSARRQRAAQEGEGRRARQPSIRIKRAYDPPEPDDGLRILIDRLWPRGMPKAKLKLDSWAKHLSPSNALRKWYQHDPEKFAEFRKRYVAELKAEGEGLDELRAAVKGRTVTLLTATKEIELSHATVLRDLLLG